MDTLKVKTMYNATKLDKELKEAGIPIHGCSSDGRVDFKDEATPAQKKLAEDVLKRHDPTPSPTPQEEYAKLMFDKDKIAFLAKRLNLD